MILALDCDEAGQERPRTHLRRNSRRPGIAVRVAPFPAGIKDANELLVSRNGDAGEVFRQVSTKPSRAVASCRPLACAGADRCPSPLTEAVAPAAAEGLSSSSATASPTRRRVQSTAPRPSARDGEGRRGERFHVDTLDLYAVAQPHRVCPPRGQGPRHRGLAVEAACWPSSSKPRRRPRRRAEARRAAAR